MRISFAGMFFHGKESSDDEMIEAPQCCGRCREGAKVHLTKVVPEISRIVASNNQATARDGMDAVCGKISGILREWDHDVTLLRRVGPYGKRSASVTTRTLVAGVKPPTESIAHCRHRRRLEERPGHGTRRATPCDQRVAFGRNTR